MATRREPTKEMSERNPTPARQFGRVSDEDWNLIKDASAAYASRKGQRESIVLWALPMLLKAAKRELGR